MDALATEARKLIYTIICFQCLLQLTEGSSYQKYLKLFSYLLTLCICCTIVFNYIGQVEESLVEADRLYDDWEKEWRQMMSIDNSQIEKEYDEQRLWEDKIIEEAYKEYDEQGSKESNNIDSEYDEQYSKESNNIDSDYKEYDSQKGEIKDVGENPSTAKGNGK